MIELVELEKFGLRDQKVRRTGGHIQTVSKVLCEDGSQRFCRVTTGYPDTWFSLPARVNVGNTTVTGFITCTTLEGYDTPSENDPMVYKFIAYKFNKNWRLLQPKEAE